MDDTKCLFGLNFGNPKRKFLKHFKINRNLVLEAPGGCAFCYCAHCRVLSAARYAKLDFQGVVFDTATDRGQEGNPQHRHNTFTKLATGVLILEALCHFCAKRYNFLNPIHRK